MIFVKDNNLKFLFPAVTISAVGDWVFQVSILLYIYNSTKSGLMVSLFILSSALPSLLFSPFIVRFLTGINNKTAMIYGDILRAILILCMLLSLQSIYYIFLINMLIGIVSTAFRTSYIKKVTQLYDINTRSKINAVLNSGSFIAMGLGSVIGAFLLNLFSVETALIFNAISYIGSCLFLIGINSDSALFHDKIKKKVTINEMIYKLFYEIKQSPILSSIIILGLSWGVVGGALNVLLPVIFMSDEAGGRLLSIFYIVQAVSMLAGCIIVYNIKFDGEKRFAFILFIIAYFFQAILFSAALFINNIYLIFIFIFLMRLCGGIIIPLDTTLIQNNSSETNLPLVYNIHSLSYTSFYQISVLVVGLMIDTFDIDRTKNIIGLTSLIVISIICLISCMFMTRKVTSNSKVV
ncbi:MFS transporter [Photorhabdus antumapuensis]|uniref:MFS transporter n=1 Tax=Photorhabdus antumapuensis TaxID=2862867 RepID=UPI001CEC8543|nr:MFS transporter [Photorhabdus antumapuensis]MCA6222473.1 MFS transporter [Photorhabdus antumapuensis]